MYYQSKSQHAVSLLQTLIPNEQTLSLLQVLAAIYEPLPLSRLTAVIELVDQSGVFERPLAAFDNDIKTHCLASDFIRITEHGIELCSHVATIALSYLTDIQWTRLKLVIQDANTDFVISDSEHRKAYWALQSGDDKAIASFFPSTKDPQVVNSVYSTALRLALCSPLTTDRLLKHSNNLQYQIIMTQLRYTTLRGEDITDTLAVLKQMLSLNPTNPPLRLLLAEYSLYTGQTQTYAQLEAQLGDSAWALQIRAIDAFIHCNFELALEHFDAALIAKRKYSKKKHQYFDELPAYIYLLTLIAQHAAGNDDALERVFSFVDSLKQNRSDVSNVLYCALLIEAISKYIQNDAQFDATKVDLHYLSKQDVFFDSLLKLTAQLGIAWTIHQGATNLITLNKLKQQFDGQGFSLLAAWCEQKSQNQAAPLQFIKVKTDWERALDKLVALNTTPKEHVNHNNTDKRIVWQLTKTRFAVELKPLLQIKKRDDWCFDGEIQLAKLKETPHLFDYLNGIDKQVCKLITRQVGTARYGEPYSLNGLKALRALCGHTQVTTKPDASLILPFIAHAPSLLVQAHQHTLDLNLEPTPEYQLAGESYAVIERNDQIRLVEFNEQHIAVLNIISDHGLQVPIEHKQQAIDSIRALSPLIDIQSNCPDLTISAIFQQPQCDLVINIKPFRQGLAFQCVVTPLGENGPSFVPGVGLEVVTALIHGERFTSTRDLQEEQRLLDLLDSLCPAFLAMQANILEQPELESALNTLEQLERVKEVSDFPIRLQWQKGKVLSISKPIQLGQLQLSLYQKNEWFDLVGELAIDEQQVIALKPLLGLINSHQGRFVTLDNGQVLSLSNELRDKLHQIDEVTDEGRFPALASHAVADITTGLRMQTVPGWEALKQKLNEANELPLHIPHTLRASLRDYQTEGVFWALRLAHFGAGACLADDMGLGKTLQALTITLSRAHLGPSLVIAPTSVCLNWQAECVKFAPTLKPIILSDLNAGEVRTERLMQLQPFDIVIISYSLLQRLSSELENIRWNTVIADEAQFLKNPLSLRSKTAYRLKSDFKLALSGTPLENNLTELWSLFRFINPGLLGNLKRFNARFTVPISKKDDDPVAAKKAYEGLKALIKPFILRRNKHDVLHELPSKTEIDLAISLSNEEMAWYESLRLSAIDTLSQTALVQNAGEQRLRMLAELVKLRQACCAPQLLLEHSTIASSKLSKLLELLKGLRANNHKVLIFSQFVGFLKLIEQSLLAQKIPYQYLDGSTPTSQRQTRIDAFQRGEGDVFLISLKAGGFGLNLTQADFVIHMDPWWNPATQDQASDRAHRIGQTKPVTVYRLYAKHTIEERILELHSQKRALADSILEGIDTAVPLEVNEVLTMLKQVF